MAKFQPEMVGDREEPAKGRMLMNEVGEETKAGWACGSRIKEVGRVISRGDENWLFLLVTLTRDAWRRGSAAEGKKAWWVDSRPAWATEHTNNIIKCSCERNERLRH